MKTTKQRHSGYVILAMLLVVFVSGSSVMLGVLNNRQALQGFTQDQELYTQLSLAKQALLSYAANSHRLHDQNIGPGYLPCPDANNNGKPDLNLIASPGTLDEDNPDAICLSTNTLGRLPEYVLSSNGSKFPLNNYQSGIDEQFWYAVSPAHLRTAINTTAFQKTDSSVSRINLDTGDNNIVALIIAPGASLNGQDRSGDQTDYDNYLESVDNLASLDYLSGANSAPASFNDTVLTITYEEYMQAISMPVIKRIQTDLNEFHTSETTYYGPTPYSDTYPFVYTYSHFLETFWDYSGDPVQPWFLFETWDSIADTDSFFGKDYHQPEVFTYEFTNSNEVVLFLNGCSGISYTINFNTGLTASGARCN